MTQKLCWLLELDIKVVTMWKFTELSKKLSKKIQKQISWFLCERKSVNYFPSREPVNKRFAHMNLFVCLTKF